jgi:hypothetical protein
MVPDRYAVVCNYREGTGTSRMGGKAYLADWHWTGGGYERVRVVARSRGGRWIVKWEPIKRLTNFRSTTVPAESPDYERAHIGWHPSRQEAQAFAEMLSKVLP